MLSSLNASFKEQKDRPGRFTMSGKNTLELSTSLKCENVQLDCFVHCFESQ